MIKEVDIKKARHAYMVYAFINRQRCDTIEMGASSSSAAPLPLHSLAFMPPSEEAPDLGA